MPCLHSYRRLPSSLTFLHLHTHTNTHTIIPVQEKGWLTAASLLKWVMSVFTHTLIDINPLCLNLLHQQTAGQEAGWSTCRTDVCVWGCWGGVNWPKSSQCPLLMTASKISLNNICILPLCIFPPFWVFISPIARERLNVAKWLKRWATPEEQKAVWNVSIRQYSSNM